MCPPSTLSLDYVVFVYKDIDKFLTSLLSHMKMYSNIADLEHYVQSISGLYELYGRLKKTN